MMQTVLRFCKLPFTFPMGKLPSFLVPYKISVIVEVSQGALEVTAWLMAFFPPQTPPIPCRLSPSPLATFFSLLFSLKNFSLTGDVYVGVATTGFHTSFCPLFPPLVLPRTPPFIPFSALFGNINPPVQVRCLFPLFLT